MKRILAQIRKEIVQLLRDRIALAMAVALPVVLMLLFGFAISLTVSDVPVAVQDLDRSPASRRPSARALPASSRRCRPKCRC